MRWCEVLAYGLQVHRPHGSPDNGFKSSSLLSLLLLLMRPLPLWKVCYVIDVGQAVDLGHSKAGEYLARDISVITEFFRRQGVVGCLKADAANQFVVGYAGPSEHEFETELGSVKENQQERKERGGDDKNEDEETPLTGYQFILEVRHPLCRCCTDIFAS